MGDADSVCDGEETTVGNGNGIYIGGGTLAVIVIIILLILIF